MELYYATLHILEVEIDFPIIGHSFLSADRVFGVTEQNFVKIES